MVLVRLEVGILAPEASQGDLYEEKQSISLCTCTVP